MANELKQLLEKHLFNLEENKFETKHKYIPKYSNDVYLNRLFNSNKDNFEKIELELELIDNNSDKQDMFDYIRHYISCMPQFQTPGRVLSILILDKTSNHYLGILQLTTCLLNSELKDDYIGINKLNKGRLNKHIRDHSANMSICVPVQPFGFNFCGGKLLAMIAFSKELHSMYEQKYDHKLALISTTSINGKSIQYDRLKQFKFIGYTKGFGTCHIPVSICEKIKNYINENYSYYNVNKKSKWQYLKFAAEKLNVNSEKLFYHGQQRGIYIGITSSQSKEFLLSNNNKKNVFVFEQDKLQYLKEINYFWMKRWAMQRFLHLNSINNFKISEEHLINGQKN
jgi:hypothetical protein